MRSFFGNLVIAAGVLIGGLSGLCAGLLLLFSLGTGVGGGPLNAIAEIFLTMGAPIGVGGALVVVGRAIAGMKPERWAGVAGVVLGAIIALATAPKVWSQVFTPTRIAGVARDPGPMAAVDCLCGLLLIAVALIEFRKRPA